MKPEQSLSDMVTQLAALNSNLSLLTATLQDFRWWLKENMEKHKAGDDQLDFWAQYHPQSTKET